MSVTESDVVETGDVVLQLFIAAFEELPCLWNPTDPHYKNKIKRNESLAQLQSIYKKCKPGATLSDVRRKINTLRCNYRKELKKIEDSKMSGADEIYTPSSWVFYAMRFITNFEEPVDLRNVQTQLDEEKEEEENENLVHIHPTSSASYSSIELPLHEPMPKRSRSIDPIAQQNELLRKTCVYLDNLSYQIEIPNIAKVWGEKLLELHPQQRAFAEKAINDILFEASQGTLHRNSVKINQEFS